VAKVEDVLQVGQPIEAMITEIRQDERRMILSLRRLAREAERRRVKEYLKTQEGEGRVTIGDAVGALLRRAVEPRNEDTAPATPAGEPKPTPAE
jgi:ribosomal protein S1